MSKKTTTKKKHKYLCPHCSKEIFPASMMAEVSNKRQNRTSEHMREMVNKRWEKHRNRVKYYGR